MNHEVQKSESLSSSEAALYNILGAFTLMFLFGGCVYQIGYPWNCSVKKRLKSLKNI